MNAGLLILRLLLGLVLLAHSTQKTLGWLQGPGLAASAGIFEGLGQRPGRAMVRLAATCEAVAAVLLLLGALTPLGAAIAAGTLLVAGASQTLRAGKLWNALGGGEYPLALAVAALAVGFTGPGMWSVDRALLDDLPDYTGLVVVAVAVVAALPPTLRARRELQRLRAVGSADL
jgi:putative oxidoreductase